MTDIIKFEKTLSSLPAILNPNTVYCVRVGTGFDLYITNSSGSVAHTLNTPEINVKKVITEVIPRFSEEGQQWIFKNVTSNIGELQYFFGGFPIFVNEEGNIYKQHTRVTEGFVVQDLYFEASPFPSTVLHAPSVSNVVNTVLQVPNPIISSSVSNFLQGEVITIYNNNNIIGTTTVVTNSWNFQVTSGIIIGTNSITYKVKDVLGNISDMSFPITLTY